MIRWKLLLSRVLNNHWREEPKAVVVAVRHGTKVLGCQAFNGNIGRLFATITYATALHRRIEVLQQSVEPCGRISDL